MEYIIYATGFLAFLLLYVAFKLSNSNEDKALRLLLIVIVGILLIVFAKATLDNTQRCFPVVNTSVELTPTTTQFNYDKYCYEENRSTPLILYKNVMWIVYTVGIFLLIYIMWVGYVFTRKLIKSGWFRKWKK